MTGGTTTRTIRMLAGAAAITIFAAVSASADAPDRDRPDQRIVGGSATTIEEWPWQVAVADSQEVAPGANGFERQFCGGSLVAPTLVITAAHCVYNFVLPVGCSELDGFDIPPEDLAVFTGRTTLSSSQGQEIGVAEIYYFDTGPGGTAVAEAQTAGDGQGLFDCETFVWDVALLKLASPSSSATIQLAGADETAIWAADMPAFITGWGATTEGGSGSDVLREAEVRMIADATCADPFVYDGALIPEVMVCAGMFPEGGIDTCQGDSGGPLVAPAEIGSAVGFRLVGDTSFGEGCARPSSPGVYGRIAADPMRGALATAAQQVAGANIVGSGARPQAVPETAIGKHPKKLVKTRKKRAKARFTFSASEPASFQCKLDGKPFKPCTSPFKRRVKAGREGGKPRRHKFRVRSTDSLGQTDASADTFKWKVKRTG